MERTRVSKQRITYLVIIMVVVSFVVAFSAIGILYNVSFEQQELRLLEVAQSRARIIEAMSSFDAKYHQHDNTGGLFEDTLSQIKEAHNNFEGFGETGEFTLAERKGDQIVFLLQHRHDHFKDILGKVESFKMGLRLAEPMQRVLNGHSGTMIGLDYRGENVLAAYEPVSWSGRKVGIVAKIDLLEIREPFVRAGLITALIAFSAILLGAIVFRKVSNPLIKNLEESEERFRAAFEHAAIGMVCNDGEGHFLRVNPSFCEMLGYSEKELLALKVEDVTHPDDRKVSRDSLRKVKVGDLDVIRLEKKYVRKGGDIIWGSVSATVVNDVNGKYLFHLAQIQDITERKKTEEALKESEELYHSLVESMNEGLAMIDEKGRFTYANKQFCKILGYSMSEIIGEHWMDFYDEGAQKVILEQLGKRVKENSESYELENTRKDGKKIWISISPQPIYDEGGNLKGSMGLVQDVTERKKVEEQINASLHEKELLLREVHHRVKNNMQVISSLLRLQADRLEDKGCAAMLKESQSRIQSMSLIHEKLYLSNDFANIDFKGYVKTLANTLIKSHGVNYDKIRLRMEIEDVSLDIENAIPCGLIINELISNSLKYAFPEEREREISISLRSISEGKLELVVADNGIGLPEDLDIRNTNTLGLYLVTMLAERQLEGELELKREVGTEYHIRFKRQDYRPRI